MYTLEIHIAEKDEFGGIKDSNLTKNAFGPHTALEISNAMTNVIEMLTKGEFLRKKILWEMKGFCDEKWLKFFFGILTQSLQLRSISLSLMGYQIQTDEIMRFQSDMKKISSKYQSICYGK